MNAIRWLLTTLLPIGIAAGCDPLGLNVFEEKAELAGGRLEAKVVDDFVAQKKEFTRDILALTKEALAKADARAFRILQDAEKDAGKLQIALAMKLAALQTTSFFRGSDAPIFMDGLEMIPGAKTYRVSIAIPNADKVSLALDGNTYSPVNPVQGFARFEIPAEKLSTRFKLANQGPSEATFELVKGGKAFYSGKVTFLPDFPIKYRLEVWSGSGPRARCHVDGGDALQRHLESVVDEDPSKRAKLQGEIATRFRSSLSWGGNEFTVPTGSEWKLDVQFERDGSRYSFSPTRLHHPSVVVHGPGDDGNGRWRYTIDVLTR